MAGLYAQNAELAGIDLSAHSVPPGGMPAGSTDMGNVSYVVPSIHPMFYIGTDAVNHTRGFTAAAGLYLSRFMRKPTMWFPNRSDTNRPLQLRLRFRM